MSLEMRPISVTIVDLLGSLVPGAIWLLLIITFEQMIYGWMVPDPRGQAITLISTIDQLTVDKGSFYYVVLLMISFSIGYSIRLLCLVVAERFCAIVPFMRGGKDLPFKAFMFPYNHEFENEPFYLKIVNVINERFSLQTDTDRSADDGDGTKLMSLPRSGTQPFSVCRRILKVISPTLWEETEAREAAVRMLGSLLLSSVLNLACSLFSFLINPRPVSVMWFATSVIVLVVLALSFRKARKAEVLYAYMNFLVAISLTKDRQPKGTRES